MSSRRVVLAGLVATGVVAAVIALALFQPWKLWIDDTVDQAAPAGARVLVAEPAVTTTAPATSSTPTPVSTPTPAAVVTSASTVTPTPAVTTTPGVTPAPAAPPPAGTEFIGIDHGTSGTLLLLVDEAGRRFVRLEDLDTSNGPDLFVYLSTNPFDGSEGAFDDDVVDLGRLQGNVGSQNYEVPADVDLDRYASVVIWCNRFNSAFGAAPLR